MQWRPILTVFIEVTDPVIKAPMPRFYPYAQLLSQLQSIMHYCCCSGYLLTDLCRY